MRWLQKCTITTSGTIKIFVNFTDATGFQYTSIDLYVKCMYNNHDVLLTVVFGIFCYLFLTANNLLFFSINTYLFLFININNNNCI